MADEVRADPVELTRLAAQVLTASQQQAEGWRGAQEALAIPAAAFGDTPAAAGVRAAHEATGADAGTGIGRLVAVLEGDVDRLYRVAFAYQQADQDAAARNQRNLRPGQPI